MYPNRETMRQRLHRRKLQDREPESKHLYTAMYPSSTEYKHLTPLIERQVMLREEGAKTEDEFVIYKANLEKTSGGFELEVDGRLRAYSFNPFGIRKGCWLLPIHWGSKLKTNPQMRAFWFATISFFLAFTGWFCLAPLLPVIRESIGICDNQPLVDIGLEKCKCVEDCKSKIGNIKIASLCSTIVMRILLGNLLVRFGPKTVQCALLTFGAIVVSATAFANSVLALVLLAACIGTLGSTFVTNQFWMPLMFTPTIVGVASGTAGGWGNLGGGVANAIMPLWYGLLQWAGFEDDMAWRGALFFPAAMLLMLVPFMWLKSQDSPIGKLDPKRDLKADNVSVWDYWKALTDLNIMILVFQYSACFGAELVMNWELATHFKDNFGLGLKQAGAITSFFGGMNLVARSLGGYVSDRMNLKSGIRGRLWVQFFCLFFEAIFLFVFGNMKGSIGWAPAFVIMVVFSLFVQMAEGATYGIVPFAAGSNLSVVAALVGAGGNLGAVICQAAFYKSSSDPYQPFLYHAAYVMFFALATFAIKIPFHGSMLFPAQLACYTQGGLFSYAIQWRLGHNTHSTDYGFFGSFIPPWRTKQLVNMRKPETYVAASTRLHFPLGAGFVGRVGKRMEPVLVRNAHIFPEHMFYRSHAAMNDGIKSIMMWPSADGETIIELGATRDLRLKDKISVRDVVAKLDGALPNAAVMCFEENPGMHPCDYDASFSKDVPFICAEMLSPLFKYALEWTVGKNKKLQVTGHYSVGIEEHDKGTSLKVNRFSTESYSYAIDVDSSYLGAAATSPQRAAMLLNNVHELNPRQFPRADLANKHGIRSVLFFKSGNRFIEVGSAVDLVLLKGKSADDVAAALEKGTLFETKLFTARSLFPAPCGWLEPVITGSPLSWKTHTPTITETFTCV